MCRMPPVFSMLVEVMPSDRQCKSSDFLHCALQFRLVYRRLEAVNAGNALSNPVSALDSLASSALFDMNVLPLVAQFLVCGVQCFLMSAPCLFAHDCIALSLATRLLLGCTARAAWAIH